MPPARSSSVCLGLGREHGRAEDAPEKLRGLLVGERRERERRRVQLAAAPAGTTLEKLRSRGRDDEQRHVGDPVDELVDEVEQALVRPVEVLEDEHERTLLGEALEEPSPGGEGLVAAVPAELRLLREAGEREQVRLDPGRVVLGERVRRRATELLGHLGGRVLLGDPGLRLDDLGERPQRDAVAVREAASLAPGDELGIRVDDALELVDEAALPDARDADEREELRRSRVTSAVEGVLDDAELALAADELRARLVRDVDAEARERAASPARRGSAPILPFASTGVGVVVVDGVPRGAVGRLVDDDPVDRSGALQARGGVDDVARGHALAGVGPRVERDERLARS